MTARKNTFAFSRAARWLALPCILSMVVCSRKPEAVYRPVTPERGTIKKYISTTGTVRPRNRLEVKPSINGRIESVLVVEGQWVRKGHVLAWMSSTERAALIDAARLQGESKLRYWEEAYKPIPLLAPIGGTVIVRDVEPGQTVSTASAVIVLADVLVVYADVDETDIGNVRKGMTAEISLDPYPDVAVSGKVRHVSYESRIINNVTMYEVEITPERVPSVFRSGMSATINIVQAVRRNALLLPLDAVLMENQRNYVLVGEGAGKGPVRREVKLGVADDTRVEVLSGIDEHSRVFTAKGETPREKKPEERSSPFLPTPRKRN